MIFPIPLNQFSIVCREFNSIIFVSGFSFKLQEEETLSDCFMAFGNHYLRHFDKQSLIVTFLSFCAWETNNYIWICLTEGLWKCRHCIWTYRMGSPGIDHFQTHEGCSDGVMNAKTSSHQGLYFGLQIEGQQILNISNLMITVSNYLWSCGLII